MKKILHMLRMAYACRLVAIFAVLLSAIPASVFATDQAYARYADNTLTFYYDGNKGQTTADYDVDVISTPGWNANSGDINKVVFDETFKDYTPTSCYRWFYNMSELSSIEGLKNLNTKQVTNMSYMFYGCSSLTELNLSSFNTSAVTNMSYMFMNCSKLATLNVSNFNTNKVTNMSAMFSGCSSLTELSILNFRTGEVTDMHDMFRFCKSLVNLDLENFDTDKVTNMSSMFSNCVLLKSVILYEFDTHEVTDMSNMFVNCSSLTSLDLSSFDTDKVTNMSGMFSDCSSLTGLNLGYFNTAAVTNMSGMFSGCKSLVNLNVTNFNTEAVTDMSEMFSYCQALSTLDLFSFNTAAVTDMSKMFSNNSSLTTIIVSKKFTTENVSSSTNMFSGCKSLKGAIAYETGKADATYANYTTGYFSQYVGPYVRCTDTTLTFYYGNDRQDGDYTIDMVEGEEDFLFPQWTIQQFKYESSTITHVVFDESFSKAQPTNTQFWFYGMENLTSIEGIENLNTSEVTSMMGMFALCRKITTFDLSYFNTSKVTSMYGMFCGCDTLQSLDLSNFDTSSVTDMRMMFDDCTLLTSINLPGVNVEKVNKMNSMFGSCKSLTTLDLSGFNTAELTDASYMFYNCSSLSTIYVSDNFTTEKIDKTSAVDMFNKCTALKGAISYDAKKIDANYANYTAGYFTKKVGTNGTDILGATGSPLTIENLTIEDNKAFKLNDGEECQAATAQYSRSMTSNWGTLCLPFAVDAAAEGNTCQFYSLQRVGTEYVELTPIETGTIEAGTPVAICKKADTQADVSITATEAKVVGEPVNVTSGDRFVGTFAGEVLNTNGYFIAKDKFFSVADYSNKGVKVSPFRAYIMTDGNAEKSTVLRIMVGGNTTGIDTIDTTDALNNPAAEYYDAAGRRTNGLQKGLNIVKTGNKTMKVIVK